MAQTLENLVPADHKFVLGFDQLLVDREFPLRIEYEIDEDPRALRLARRSAFEIHVRQPWKGEVVRGVGLRLVPAESRKEPGRGRERTPEKRVPIG